MHVSSQNSNPNATYKKDKEGKGVFVIIVMKNTPFPIAISQVGLGPFSFFFEKKINKMNPT